MKTKQRTGINVLECEERLRFESLLVDISSRFVSVPSGEVDQSIEEALQQVCECLGLDLSALWQWEADSPDVFILTHLYRRHEGPPVPERMEATEYNPWALSELTANRPIIFSSVADAPPEAVQDQNTWRHFGIKSVLALPLSVGGAAPFGVVSFHDVDAERTWCAATVQRLNVVAQVFAGVLMRRRLERAQKENDERLKLALDIADAGTWVWSAERREFWVTDRLAEFFHLPPGSPLPYETFLSLVHEEDRVHVAEALASAQNSSDLVVIEYRIAYPDGSVRWMHARGRVCRTRDGGERLMGTSADVTGRRQAELELGKTLQELELLRRQLKRENVYLRDRLRSETGNARILGDSPVMHQVLEMARRVAETESTVLITGETGTGKELLAQTIHDCSSRRDRAMVTVNCAALPGPLIESELFGREKGAYTGAMTRQTGRFEVANGSTLFLDEIGDLPIDLQAKLLRVLQDGCFERLGSHETRRTNVRVIAATNQDLGKMVQEGTFREDLYHRLNVFPVESPPLRERIEDIPELTWHFVQIFNRKMGRSVSSIPKSAMDQLKAYDWPGNVRELRNLVERAMILSRDTVLCMNVPEMQTDWQPAAGRIDRLPKAEGRTEEYTPGLSTLEEMERNHILKALETAHWRIGGDGGAAEILGMPRTTLNARIKRLGIVKN